MTLLYNVFIPLATNLLNTYGATATFRQITRTFNTATRKNTVARRNTTIKIQPPQPYNVSRINGTTIQIGDLMTMVASEALTVVPTTNDLINYLRR